MTNETHQINQGPCTFPTGISFLYTMTGLVDDTANILCWRALCNMHHSVYNISHRLAQSTLPVSWWGARRCRWWPVLCSIVPAKITHRVLSIQLAQLTRSQMYTQQQSTSRRCYVRLHGIAFQGTRISVKLRLRL